MIFLSERTALSSFILRIVNLAVTIYFLLYFLVLFTMYIASTKIIVFIFPGLIVNYT